MESDSRKRLKEQRNLKSLQAGNLSTKSLSREPLFGKPIEKRGGDDRIQEILGKYGDFPSNWMAQQSFLGVDSSTPSTPVAGSNKTNPFNSISISSSSLTSSITASSRHQVAQAPTGGSVHSLKRDKSKTTSKPSKLESKTAIGSFSKERLAEVEEKQASSLQPTNILRVSKPNKTSVKLHKVSQKKTAPKKPVKVKKSHSSSHLLTSSISSSSELPSNSSTILSQKLKKHSSNTLPVAPPQDSSTLSLPPSIKRVSSAGLLSSKPDPKSLAGVGKAMKKKKKKKVKKESSTIAPSQVTNEPTNAAPKSLKVQLPKQKRPLDLQLVSSGVVSEDTTMDAESVSSMLKELMNPLPSTLVTPIPTPIKARPFEFPPAAPHLSSIAENTFVETKSRLSSTSSDEDPRDAKSREALATAVSTLENNKGVAVDYAPLQMARPLHSESSSSSSSDDSSSDSSSDGETEEDTLDFFCQQMSLPTTTITPIKTTPPRRISQQLISPLALDESANLSPAKNEPSSHLTSSAQPIVGTQSSVGFNPQNSVGFNPQNSIGFSPLVNAANSEVVKEVTDATVNYDSDSSSGSSSDSGSESDSESSDSEDDTLVLLNSSQQSNSTRSNLNQSQLSEDYPLPFDNSGVFLEGTDFLGGLNVMPSLSSNPVQSIASNTTNSTLTSEPLQPFTITSNSVANTTSSSSIVSPAVLSSSITTHAQLKRKNPSTQTTARKAPKLTVKEAANTIQTQSSRPISITSSECHSEEGEVSSESEEQPVFSSQPAATNRITQSKQSYIDTQRSTSFRKEDTESLIVRYALAELKRVPDQHKPKAKVEPFRQSTESRTRSRNLESEQSSERHDTPRSLGRERSEGRDRDGYGSVSSRHRDEYNRSSYHRDRSNDRPRSRHGANRWDRESSRDRRYPPDDRHHSSGRGWDRGGEYEYWTDDHSDYGGGERSRGGRGGRYGGESQNYSEKYMSEARRKKHEADKMPLSVDKARAYMEAVVLFMKYGDAIEQQSESSGTGSKKANSAFRTYSETVAMIKYCQNMANECKPLLVLCMRCQSVLLWRLYVLKLPTATTIQKELQEYFIPPKGSQGKSPYPNSSSPLPSPASVGSTASTGSGGWTANQDPSPSGSAVVPKHIVSKATEHLTLSGYVSGSIELWKTSDSLVYQCRDFFSKQPSNLRMSQCSPVSQVANWSDKILRSLRYSNY